MKPEQNNLKCSLKEVICQVPKYFKPQYLAKYTIFLEKNYKHAQLNILNIFAYNLGIFDFDNYFQDGSVPLKCKSLYHIVCVKNSISKISARWSCATAVWYLPNICLCIAGDITAAAKKSLPGPQLCSRPAMPQQSIQGREPANQPGGDNMEPSKKKAKVTQVRSHYLTTCVIYFKHN